MPVTPHKIITDKYGNRMRVFHRAYLANLIGLKLDTVYRWNLRGIVPKPALFDETTGLYWYTPDEVTTYIRAYYAYNVRNGIKQKGSEFSCDVTAHTLQIKEEIELNGFGSLHKAINIAQFLDEMRNLKSSLDLSSHRPMGRRALYNRKLHKRMLRKLRALLPEEEYEAFLEEQS